MTSITSKIFPNLSTEQIDYLRTIGAEIQFKKGAILIEEGTKSYDFFVVLEGKVDIVDPSNNNKLITRHQAGEFTGDSDMLSERASIFYSSRCNGLYSA